MPVGLGWASNEDGLRGRHLLGACLRSSRQMRGACPRLDPGSSKGVWRCADTRECRWANGWRRFLHSSCRQENETEQAGERQRLQGRVTQKWGFGMAPPKAETLNARQTAASAFLRVLQSEEMPVASDELLSAISTVKGLFNRVVRQNQWDWFTVAAQLGYPSRRISRVIAGECARMRTAIRGRDLTVFANARVNLLRLPTRRCLAIHGGHALIADEDGAGWLYVLSTRESPSLLKVGMTTRSVEERVKEINGATGVAVPFGVRQCWRVADPPAAERLAHKTLSEFRVRDDREFFQVHFRDAVERLDAAVRHSGLEIRTLDALGGLAETG